MCSPRRQLGRTIPLDGSPPNKTQVAVQQLMNHRVNQVAAKRGIDARADSPFNNKNYFGRPLTKKRRSSVNMGGGSNGSGTGINV